MSSENTDDLDALADCFAAHAAVRDEGQTMTGLKAIALWRVEPEKEQRHTVVEPVTIATRDGKIVVRTRLTGDFSGSPITLDLAFTREGDKIVALEIQS